MPEGPGLAPFDLPRKRLEHALLTGRFDLEDGPATLLFFRGLPEKVFSSALNSTLLQQVQRRTSLYDAAISEIEQMPWDEAYLKKHITSFESRPIRVLTTWHFGRPPGTPPDVHRNRMAFEHDSARAQGSWLRLSTNSRQIFDYEEANRYLQLDRPRIVLSAIREVLDAPPP